MGGAFHCVECGDGQHCTGENGCVAEAARQVFGFRPAPPPYSPDPIIARALALLDRVGDAAAEAILKGEAAVVPVEATAEMVWANSRAAPTGETTGHAYVQWAPNARWIAMLAAGRLDKENDDA
jgi:hypothetical protein